MQRTGLLNPAAASSCASASPRVSHAQQPNRPRSVAVAASDRLCKDMVNSVRERNTGESSECVTISFLGAGGQKMSVECPKDTYVLDAGLDAGIELPYTCRGGICGACVGRVVTGKLDQSDIADLSFTLNDEELEQGMALLCMSRPETDCSIETQSDWGYSLGIAEWKGPSGQIAGKQVDPLTPWKE